MMNTFRKIVGLHFALGVLSCGIAFSQQPPADNAQVPPVSGLVPDHATLSAQKTSIERRHGMSESSDSSLFRSLAPILI